MAVDFSGTWKLDRSENFDEYLKAIDVNAVKRKMAQGIKPTQIIKQNGDSFEVETQGGQKEGKLTYTLGQEITHNVPPQNVEMKVIATMEGDVLVTVMKPKVEGKGKGQTVRRKIENGELVTEITVGAVTCKRIFKRA